MPTPDASDNDARMAHARDGLLTKAIATAHERAASLGLTITDEQAEEAGRRILKTEQAARAAQARVKAQEKAKAETLDWAMRQTRTYANLLHTWEPTVPYEQQLLVVGMAVSDELQAPDGLKRPRLIKRLQVLVDTVKAQSRATSDRLNATLVEQPDWDSLPDLRDLTGPLPGDQPGV
jgi:hypothetical protein